jgi:predicted RNase H-like nuclease (RuvC/YqgF family)
MSRGLLQIIGYVVLLAAIVLAGYMLVRHLQKMEQRMREIEERKVQIVNIDSITSVIERRLVDSLNTVVVNQDKKIDALRQDLTKTRRKNEALEKRFNDIVVTMPDF